MANMKKGKPTTIDKFRCNYWSLIGGDSWVGCQVSLTESHENLLSPSFGVRFNVLPQFESTP